MRIAFVTCTFPPYQGGIGNVSAALANELSSRGHQLTVFTPDYGLRDNFKTPYEVKRLGSFIRYGNASFLPQLYNLVKNFDVVHLHYPFSAVPKQFGPGPNCTTCRF